MTQSEKVLECLILNGPGGVTAKKLTDLYVPQYCWCIMQLRKQGHVIDSRREKDRDGKIRWRFFYRGQNKATMSTPSKHEHAHDGHGNLMHLGID